MTVSQNALLMVQMRLPSVEQELGRVKMMSVNAGAYIIDVQIMLNPKTWICTKKCEDQLSQYQKMLAYE